jgi:hypothetical protein
MLEWIDRLITQVNQKGQFATNDRRQEVLDIFQRARNRVIGILESRAISWKRSA